MQKGPSTYCQCSGRVQLCMGFPKERSKDCWLGWRDGTGIVPRLTRGAAEISLCIFPAALWFSVCLLFWTSKPRVEGWTGQAVLGIVPFEILELEREDTLLTFTDNPTLGGDVEVLQGRAALQGTQRNLEKLHKDKCKVLPLPRDTPAADPASPCTNSILTPAQI